MRSAAPPRRPRESRLNSCSENLKRSSTVTSGPVIAPPLCPVLMQHGDDRTVFGVADHREIAQAINVAADTLSNSAISQSPTAQAQRYASTAYAGFYIRVFQQMRYQSVRHTSLVCADRCVFSQ